MNPTHSNIRLNLVFFGAALAAYLPAQAQTVQKTADPFENPTWRMADDSSAGGSFKLSNDVPQDLRATSKSSADFEASFSGHGFEFYKGTPTAPLTIPGVTKKLSLWVKADKKYGWVLQFKDGYGRGEAGGKLEWNITQGSDGNWKKITFDVPPNWVQPISIDGVLAHNWENQGEKASGHLYLDQLQVETDISGVDPETGILDSWKAAGTPADPTAGNNLPKTAPVTPVLKVNLAGTALYNVFSGEGPQFLLTAQNWKAQPATGTMQWKATAPDGTVVKSGTQPLNIEDNFALSLPLDTKKFGVYKFDSTISWADGKKTSTSQPYAVIPIAKELTDAEKDASPYGLNVLSARQPMVSTFRKAGVIWFRDYGFDYEWMLRAKGADKSYGGWPWYPKIVKTYEDSGVRVLANLKSAIKPPANGSVGPDANWTREMVSIMTAFPSLKAFELDNEYDLNGSNAKAEEAISWKNYDKFHKKFGDVAHLLSDNQFVTVENGRAGIWPERLRRAIDSGDFAPIDVVNSHHYAGIDPPETNVINHNMGFSGDENILSFFDQLRAAKKSGAADGKVRQHWLTEFGWDTKAGPIVSARQQAAYLARGFMMLAAAGTDKGFWYWDLDSPGANQFFDGCGLFTYDQMPKLSYAAYAGLTQMLPKPEYLGMIKEGEGTWGYLFRNEGKLVATLWTIDDKKGPNVNFEGAKVYDYFANPLESSTVALSMDPVYAVGVTPESRWYKQTAYSLESPYLVSVTAGDSVTANLQVKNTRQSAISGKVKLELPAGWTDATGEKAISVEPGKTGIIPLTFRIGTDEQLGEKTVKLSISEGAPLNTIPLRVQIQRPIMMTVRGLTGEPGNSDVRIRISNRSARPLEGVLKLKVPASWSATAPEIKVDNLKPMEVRDITTQVKWTADWKEGEVAAVVYTSTDGRTSEQPIIPSRLTIHSAPKLVMDGDLKDWPTKNKLPDWVLGSTVGEPNASVYMAWSPQGLNVALDVHDSKAIVPDPKSFWSGEVLELFIDTRDKKTTRSFEPGDHQFWLAPLLDQKRIYLGQWKRGSEIAETVYDKPGLQGTAVKRGDGYVMEFLIPASMLTGYKPTVGSKIGLNLNLSVKGEKVEREVFWTVPKSDGVDQPAGWGSVTLGN